MNSQHWTSPQNKAPLTRGRVVMAISSWAPCTDPQGHQCSEIHGHGTCWCQERFRSPFFASDHHSWSQSAEGYSEHCSGATRVLLSHPLLTHPQLGRSFFLFSFFFSLISFLFVLQTTQLSFFQIKADSHFRGGPRFLP